MIEIDVLLDRSGSMGAVVTDAISGFNSFLAREQNQRPDSILTLVQFDTNYHVVYDGQPVTHCAPLNTQTYQPQGSTALYDAVGRCIVSVGDRLHKTPPHDRPSKVLFAILTDGLENASTQYTSKRIQEMITHQRDVYSWEFVFLAANQDAWAVGSKMGIATSVNIQATGAGMRAYGQTMSEAVNYVASNQTMTANNLQRGYNFAVEKEELEESK